MSSYTSRRTYLLNRLAWGLVGIGVIYLIWGDYYKWPVVAICGGGAALCWLLAGRIEKGRADRHARATDEEGNIRPNKL